MARIMPHSTVRRALSSLPARPLTELSRSSISLAAGPSALLSAAITNDGWRVDEAQRTAAELLQRLWEHRVQGEQADLAGIYIHGPVGSGKTALMDLTLQAGTTAGLTCTRMHFHELMRYAHQQMHTEKLSPSEIGRALGADANDLLCLDEMQITDIADAAIVSRLLSGILEAGAALVTTSNRPPHELYLGGLNRHVYVPALCATLASAGVVQHCLEADGGDYRDVLTAVASRRRTAAESESASRYYPERRGLVASLESRGGPLRPHPPLALSRSRSMPIRRANDGCCVLTFEEVCDAPLAAHDYLTLAERFRVVGLEDVPALTTEHHNAARRLIMLIDVLYDRQVELHVASTTPLERLFDGLASAAAVASEHTDGARGTVGAIRGQRTPSAGGAPLGGATVSMRGEGGASARLSSTWMSDGSEWSATGRLGVSLAALSGLQDAAFARRRAISRLREMCLSDNWPPLVPRGHASSQNGAR